MNWTDQTWSAFHCLLEEGWPGEFDDATSNAYRVLLDGIEPERAAGAVRALLRTSRFRPSAAEIVQACERDARHPTFDEAFHLLFSHPRSPLKRRTTGEAVAAAMEFHPLVARFIQVLGRDRLSYMEVFDPDYGRIRRDELRSTWLELADATAGRDLAALVAGAGERRGELGRFDPLQALGMDQKALGSAKETA